MAPGVFELDTGMVSSCATHPVRPARRQGGFTLMEALMTTVIVGTAVLAIVAAQQAYHMQNGQAQHMGAGLLLANELRELTLNLPQRDPITGANYWGPEPGETSLVQYDDLDDFDGPAGEGLTISPPIDATGRVIPNMTQWSQVVTVENVLPNYLSAQSAAPDHSTSVVRITCVVRFQRNPESPAETVTQMTWTRAGQ